MTEWRWHNFTREEMLCRCNCGFMALDEAFMDALQELRTAADFPFRISSASRCPAHNSKVSGTGEAGPHTKGAVDIKVAGRHALRLISLAPRHGFTGIGVMQKGPHDARYVHLDRLPNADGQPRPWLWSY